MKKFILLTLCSLALFNANFASAQSDGASTTPASPATTTQSVLPAIPQVIYEIMPDPQPAAEPQPNPAPTPAPTEEEQPADTSTSTSPIIGSAGASADPDVLAAQNSEPAAGAGNVYRGNALSAAVTQFLLLAALGLAALGLILAERQAFVRALQVFAPRQPARFGA